jgi:AcrR family transcriptional regulator
MVEHGTGLASEPLDPRVRRTRALLHDSFLGLVKVKPFEEISVQDITEAATVNRATFYAHYRDKYALLECVAGMQFEELLQNRGVRFDGTCPSAIRAIVLGVYDYLSTESSRVGNVDALDLHLQAAVVAVVRRMLLEGLGQMRDWKSPVSREMAATSTAWALYSAVRDWYSGGNRAPAEKIVDAIYNFLLPLLKPA